MAVDHLNSHGDFSYRNYSIGYRRVTLKRIDFAPRSDKLLSNHNPSLGVVGTIMGINKSIQLKIVVYKNGNHSLAAVRAGAVKKYFLRHYPEIYPSRITTEAFGKKERIVTEQRTYFLDDSISFVTTKT